MIFHPEIGEDLTMEFASTARELIKKKVDIISFGLGEPGFSTPEHIIAACVDALNVDKFRRYSDPQGLFELRTEIARTENSALETKYTESNVLVTPGTKQALFLCLLSILQPGDEIINFSPSYVCYIPDILIAESSAVVRTVLLKQDYSIDFNALEDAINSKTRALIINSPHNPTGRMLSDIEISLLCEICIKRGIYVISDEIYRTLNFSGKRHLSIATNPYMSELAIVISGFSKAYSMTGWRVGYLLAPERLVKKMKKLQVHLNTNTCAFIQKAALAALTGSQEHLTVYNSQLAEKASFLSTVFDSNILPARPEGGFFAFLDISMTQMNSNEFASRLIQEKSVATSPGIAFGKTCDDKIRISLIEDIDRFKDGLTRIVEFMQQYKRY